MKIITKNKKGYSLVEIMMVVGLIAFLMTTIYVVYQRMNNKYKAEFVAQELSMLKENINRSFATTLSPTELTNEFMLSSNLVPNSLVISENQISNGYGGLLDLGVDGNSFTITLKDVPNDACSYLTATDFFRYAPGIKVNATTIKTTGPVNGEHVADMAVNCAVNTNATLVASYPITHVKLPNQGILDSGRAKELPKNIARISAGESALVCEGGASWSNNFCSCPSGTEWNGQECVSFGDVSKQAGWCILGEGSSVDSPECKDLPHKSNSVNLSEQTYKYSDGKYTTSASKVRRINDKQGSYVKNEGKTVNVGGKTITYGEGHFDNNTLQVCVNGSWDSQSNSCVTPISQ